MLAYLLIITSLWCTGSITATLYRGQASSVWIPDVEAEDEDEGDAGQVLVHIESQRLKHLPAACTSCTCSLILPDFTSYVHGSSCNALLFCLILPPLFL